MIFDSILIEKSVNGTYPYDLVTYYKVVYKTKERSGCLYYTRCPDEARGVREFLYHLPTELLEDIIMVKTCRNTPSLVLCDKGGNDAA
jgi:hypothetical protein